MPTDAWGVAQFIVNVLALVGGAAAWMLYVSALKASVDAKSASIESVEKSRDLWKDKVADLERKVVDLEKRSPEFMEGILEERIHRQENEIRRLREDGREAETERLKAAERAKTALQNELARTRGFRAMLELDDPDGDGDGADWSTLTGGPGEMEVKLLGFVGVDSGQLMVTDPCYIDSEWQEQPMQHLTAYLDTKTDRTYTHGEDFIRYDKGLDGLEGTVRDNIDSGRLIEQPIQPERPFPYSYRGALNATLTDGYGELQYRIGEPGAGVVFSTAWGDGFYPVYGELIDGRIVRVYVNTG